MSTDKFSDITTGRRQVHESQKKPVYKKYRCGSCDHEEADRKKIREHVKSCQPQWKNEHPDTREPLSTRYRSIKVGEK